MRELFKRVWKKEEGFSLIELIIVIAILAIIAAIAVPALLGNIEKANVSADRSNAKLIADSIAIAVASDPALSGTTLGTATTASPPVITPAEFTTTGGNALITAAITGLNEGIPTIKSSAHGTVGNKFFVYVAASGVIAVYGSDGTTELFPTP